MDSELANQVGAGVIIAYALEALKKSNHFRFLNEDQSGFYKGAVGFIAALLTTIGIHYTFDYDYNVGGQLIFTIPSLEVFGHSIWDFMRQWAFQQASYDGFVKKSEVKNA
jgi:hypothetical protein